MKRLLLLLLLLGGTASAQITVSYSLPTAHAVVSPTDFQISWFPRLFSGAPSGSCSSADIGINTSNGALSACNSGAWVSVGLPTGVSFSSPTLTISSAGSGNGQLALSGNTSGAATFTAPAIAGTTTNPVAMSNVVNGPAGNASAVTYGVNGGNGAGLYNEAGVGAAIASSSTLSMAFPFSEGRLLSTGRITWCPSTTINCTIDSGVSRSGIGIVAVGNGGAGDTTGRLKASGYISVGTKFTTNNGCTDSATAGGATAGTFTVGSTSCTEVITMGDGATAPNGWSCTVVDITTLADVTNPHQTTSNATTATIVTGTVVSGDKIQFSCIGY